MSTANISSARSQLMSPLRIGELTLPNRIVMAPLTRARAGKSRVANDLMAEYYSQRALAGLIISEATVISEQGIGWPDTPGIYTDEMTDGWKQVVDAVHDQGGRMFLQVWHMGRASHSDCHDGELPVGPSEVPRALAIEELPRIVEDYRQAAERASQRASMASRFIRPMAICSTSFFSRNPTIAQTGTAAVKLT